MKGNKINLENKKEKGFFQRILSFKSFFSAISRSSLAIALLILMCSIVSAADIIVQNGNLTMEGNLSGKYLYGNLSQGTDVECNDIVGGSDNNYCVDATGIATSEWATIDVNNVNYSEVSSWVNVTSLPDLMNISKFGNAFINVTALSGMDTGWVNYSEVSGWVNVTSLPALMNTSVHATNLVYKNQTSTPTINNTYNLGSVLLEWANGYFVNLRVGTLTLVNKLTDVQLEDDITANWSKLTNKPNGLEQGDVFINDTQWATIDDNNLNYSQIGDLLNKTQTNTSAELEAYLTHDNIQGAGIVDTWQEIDVFVNKTGNETITGWVKVEGDVNVTKNLTVGERVGIGTDAPVSKLTVYQSSIGASTVSAGMTLDANYGAASSAQSIDFLINSNTNKAARIVVPTEGSTGELAFYTTTNFMNVTPTEKVRISSGGNVGIGTTNPVSLLAVGGTSPDSYYKLYVAGDVLSSNGYTITGGASFASNGIYTATNDMLFRTYASGVQTRMTILANNGNVGIGTTTPSQKLHVQGNANITGNIYYDGSLVPYSPHVFGVDSEVGYTRACWYDEEGYWNLVWFKGGVQQVEKNSPVCQEKVNKINARTNCEKQEGMTWDYNTNACVAIGITEI